MAGWLVILCSLGYLALLFALARWGEKFAAERPLLARHMDRAGVYALTLAIHNTAWSFYGSVGRAAQSAFANLPTYLGITLFLIFGQGLLRRVVRIAKARNVTSIADFISSRYDKSRPVAAFVTLAAFIGVLPYMALQFKAVGFSFLILTGGVAKGEAGFAQRLGAPDFWAACFLASFTMVIGVRHIHASERHRGFVLALAVESVVKIVAFLLVAVFAIYASSTGVSDLLASAARDPELAKLLTFDFTAPTPYAFGAVAFLSFLCMPHSFHVAVVENDGEETIRPAAWIYTAYMAVFAVLVTPMAIAGLRMLGPGVNPDTFAIAIPVAANQQLLALASFIGGLSAATGMVMVTTVALSTMLCNDVIVPLLVRRGAPAVLQESATGDAPLASKLLIIRRTLVVVVILLAFLMQRLIDARTPLMHMGVMSFVAMAQFAPAFFGGLLWSRASGAGAICGLALGLAIWAYALLLPAIGASIGLPADFATRGPFGAAWLSPYGLLGLGGLDPLAHAIFWSLLLNFAAFIAVSLVTPASEMTHERSLAFIEGAAPTLGARPRIERIGDLIALAARFAGREFVDDAFRRRAGGVLSEQAAATDDDIVFTESLIAGAVGAGTARIVMAAALRGRASTPRAANLILDEAATALQFSHGLLQAITDNVAQGIVAFDADLRVLAWNARVLDILDLPKGFLRVGLPLQEIVDHNLARGEYADDDLPRLFINRPREETTWPYVYERRRPNGDVLEIAVSRMAGGGFVATYSDVTERVATATALQAANEQLETRVAQRTRALEESKREAEQANASKTRFLAAASHDLLQPLSAARLFLSTMQEELREAPPQAEAATLRASADNALAALESTERLLSELLYASTLDARAVQVNRAPVALETLFAQLQREFTPLAQTRGLRLRAVETSLIVDADAALLRRVLQNFLSNAIRYTPRGGVLLGCQRRGETARITVFDTGVGVPAELREAIFEEFRRLTPAGTEAPGLGLGLAIVERIARLLEAPVTVRSQPGRGSMFAISLPLATHCAPESSLRAAAAPPPHAAWSILCVDDHASIRDGMMMLLTRWGHRVTLAKDGAQALSVVEQVAPDVILIDFHFDGGPNGLDILAALRARLARPTPAIIVTADRSDALLGAAQRAGCAVLHKPFQPDALRALLDRAPEARSDDQLCEDAQQ